MRILVMGGTGFIGSHVVRRLTSMGHEVTVYHRGQTEAALPPGIRHIHGDRQRLAESMIDLKLLAPDVVLDMFPYSEDDARTLMSTFAGLVHRVVAISSMDVYRAYDRLHGRESSPIDPVPLTEEAPLRRKLYPYPQKATYEKILVERVVMGHADLPGTILRLPMVYGPHDDLHRLFFYLKRMIDRRPAILLDEGMARWRGTRGYVHNVGAAIALAVTDDRAAGRIYNVGEMDPVTETDWVKAIGHAVGWAGDVAVVPKATLPTHLKWWGEANTDQHWVVDTTRLRTELGYQEPVPQAEALQHTAAWECANPPETLEPQMFDYAAEDAVLRAMPRQR